MLLAASFSGLKAQDSTAVELPFPKRPKIVPLKATMLAATLPGMGQIYTRKYWKVPFVYAGFAAIGYAVAYNTKYYNLYTKAYQDFTDKIPETKSYLDIIINFSPDKYDPVLFPKSYIPGNAAHIKDLLLNKVDYFKRYRDLSLIGVGAWYLFTILDANVDASLFDYDVGENINLSLAPFQYPMYNYAVAGVSVTLTVNF
jgi:hypothetical protein